MKNYLLIIVLFCSFSSLEIKAQSEQQKWTIGISIAGGKYSPENGLIVGGQLAYQSPRFNISRYLFKGLIMDVAFATALGDNQKYTTYDGTLRYDFRMSDKKLVPYVLLGGSFINAIRLTPTLNSGAGDTYWFGSKFGINGQGMYKFSEDRFQSQKSHLYASLGLVFRFGANGGNPRSKKQPTCF